MRLFRFEKWFTDVMTPSREYLIVFHTLLELFGFRICFVEINLARYHRDQTFHLNRKIRLRKRQGHRVTTRRCDLLLEEKNGRIRITLPEVDMDLNISPAYRCDFNQPGMVIRRRRGGWLEWRPLILNARVTGYMTFNEKGGTDKNQALTERFEGIGYSDYLFSSMAPWNVPVVQLFWGRLHTGELDMTYSFALDKHGQEPVGASVMFCRKGEYFHLERASLNATGWEKASTLGISTPSNYTLTAASGNISIELEISHLKEAIVSEFWKNPREMGRLARGMLRHLSKEPRGIKYFSSARLKLDFRGQVLTMSEVLMIDEYVRFI